MSDYKVIPAEELSAYERWELPSLGADRPKTSNSFSAPAPKKAKFPTASEIEKIRRAAYDEGFQEGKTEGLELGRNEGHAQGLAMGEQEGKAQGLQQGLAEGQQQIQKQSAQLAALIQSLADPVATQTELVTQAMANMATAIARSVVHRELHTDSATVVALALEAIRMIPKESKQAILFVNPADMPYFEDFMADSELALQVQTDPSIHVGGCKLSSATQLIDYTVEKRFQKTIQSMLLAMSQQSSPNSSTNSSPTLASGNASAIQDLSEYPSSLLDDAAAEQEQDPEGLAVQPLSQEIHSSSQNESSSQEDLHTQDDSGVPES